MNQKEKNINCLLNNFMDSVEQIPASCPSEGVRHAVTACLRFASRASILLGISIDEVKTELETEWKEQEADCGQKAFN